MPARVKLWRTCRKPKPRCLSAPRELSVGGHRSDRIWSEKPAASKSLQPKLGSVTHAICERARRMRPKSKRTENLSEEQCQPKPIVLPRRATNYQMLFCRLTPELSRAERDGWEPVLLACPEVSTKPRHGIGLNDLLGGPDAGEGEALTILPRKPKPGCRNAHL